MNEIPYFSTAHPETSAHEVYLGNFTQEEAMSIGFKTKRHGVKSYCVDGSDYPFQTEHGVLPYFADKRELSEADLQWLE